MEVVLKMDDEKKKEMTQEEAEQDFKDAVAKIFKDKVPGAYVDEDGLIVIPRRGRRKKDE